MKSSISEKCTRQPDTSDSGKTLPAPRRPSVHIRTAPAAPGAAHVRAVAASVRLPSSATWAGFWIWGAMGGKLDESREKMIPD